MEWPYNSEQDSLGYYSFEPGQENTHAPQSQPDYAYHVSPGHGISPDDMIIDNPQTDQQDFTCFQTMQPISYTFEQLTQLSLDMTMLGPDQVNQAQSLTQPLHFDEMHSTFAEMSLDSINTTLLPQIATGTGQHPQPSSQEITDQEWEAKKEDIRRVYIRDNLSLKKTMELLKSSWRRPPTSVSCFAWSHKR